MTIERLQLLNQLQQPVECVAAVCCLMAGRLPGFRVPLSQSGSAVLCGAAVAHATRQRYARRDRSKSEQSSGYQTLESCARARHGCPAPDRGDGPGQPRRHAPAAPGRRRTSWRRPGKGRLPWTRRPEWSQLRSHLGSRRIWEFLTAVGLVRLSFSTSPGTAVTANLGVKIAPIPQQTWHRKKVCRL